MPISIKEMESKGVEVAEAPRGKNIEDIKQFFGKPENKGQAFTQKEIAEALGIRPPAARSALNSIIKKTASRQVHMERKSVETDGNMRIHYCYVKG